MKYKAKLGEEDYVAVEYYQYNHGKLFSVIWKVGCIFCFPILVPIILISKISDGAFKACSELLSILPSALGYIFRYVFYKFSMKHLGKNVFIDFGTIFYYPNISIGNNVTFGIGNIIQHCDFGNNVLVGDGCRFVGGTKKHNFQRTDIPICFQNGKIKQIRVSDDTWIDSSCVIMCCIGKGCVVKAGSVVREKPPPYSTCEGNPSRIIGNRIENSTI